jgi:hypothetical protein
LERQIISCGAGECKFPAVAHRRAADARLNSETAFLCRPTTQAPGGGACDWSPHVRLGGSCKAGELRKFLTRVINTRGRRGLAAMITGGLWVQGGARWIYMPRKGCTHTHTHTHRERARERERAQQPAMGDGTKAQLPLSISRAPLQEASNEMSS